MAGQKRPPQQTAENRARAIGRKWTVPGMPDLQIGHITGKKPPNRCGKDETRDAA